MVDGEGHLQDCSGVIVNVCLIMQLLVMSLYLIAPMVQLGARRFLGGNP